MSIFFSIFFLFILYGILTLSFICFLYVRPVLCLAFAMSNIFYYTFLSKFLFLLQLPQLYRPLQSAMDFPLLSSIFLQVWSTDIYYAYLALPCSLLLIQLLALSSLLLYGSYSSQYSCFASAVVVASAAETVTAILELPMLSPLLALPFSPLQQCTDSFSLCLTSFFLSYTFIEMCFKSQKDLDFYRNYGFVVKRFCISF